MPVSRATTAPISSSVCRLPFISAAALPSRTRATALAADSWLCADFDDRQIGNVDVVTRRHVANPGGRADQDRFDQPQLACLHGAAERHLVARMRHGGDDRRQFLCRADQAQILVVRPRANVRKLSRLVFHSASNNASGVTMCIDVDQ